MSSTATLTHTAALTRLGSALSDGTRARILLALRTTPAFPSELADSLGVTRQVMSNQLACLRGCGLVIGVPEGRRVRYHLAQPSLTPVLEELLRLALAVDPECCSGTGCRCV